MTWMPRRKVCTDRPLECRGAARGRQHVVGAGAVVAEGHRRPRADEDRAGVADLGRDLGRVGGLDLQVLGGVGVDDADARVDVVDQDDGRLRAGQRGRDPLPVHGGLQLGAQFGVDRVGERGARRDQDAGGHFVVLGLRDQVGGDVHRVGGVVGQDGDLGRAGLGVDADPRRGAAAWRR